MDTIAGLKFPDLTLAKRILAIQPHYDDNDIAVGGTLHTLWKQGAELIYLTVTDDLAGVIHPEWTKDVALYQLKENQDQAAGMIGVSKQIHLGFPDAGEINYFDLRKAIIRQILEIQPDFIFTVDPWTPYEAHNDHILTGKAVAEAAILHTLPVFREENQQEIMGYAFQGVVFYNSAYPNMIFDISDVLEAKQHALRAYSAQFTPDGLRALVAQTTFLASYVARDEPFKHGEAIKIVAPWMLHGVPITKQL